MVLLNGSVLISVVGTWAFMPTAKNRTNSVRIVALVVANRLSRVANLGKGSLRHFELKSGQNVQSLKSPVGRWINER